AAPATPPRGLGVSVYPRAGRPHPSPVHEQVRPPRRRRFQRQGAAAARADEGTAGVAREGGDPGPARPPAPGAVAPVRRADGPRESPARRCLSGPKGNGGGNEKGPRAFARGPFSLTAPPSSDVAGGRSALARLPRLRKLRDFRARIIGVGLGAVGAATQTDPAQGG